MDYSEKIRRPMSEALRTAKLNDEERAFVAGSPASQRAAPSPETAEPPAKLEGASRRIPESIAMGGPISMTFRLPCDLPPLLFSAAAERKAKREHPFTQQDIVAEALRGWLQLHGYVSDW